MNENEIVERLGAENWDEVNTEFAGKVFREVEFVVNLMWPSEDNMDLIQAIYERSD